MIPTYKDYQPYEFAIPGLRDLINSQLAGGQPQMQDVFDLTKLGLPEFDPNLVSGVNERRKAAATALLGTPDWQSSPFQNYITPEATGVANKLIGTNENLLNAQSNYSAQGGDFDRAMTRYKQTYADRMMKANMMNATESSIKAKQKDMMLSGIRNQSEYTRINKEYQAKLEMLKQQAEDARQRGDTQAWISILQTIGTVLGAALL